MSRRHAPLRRVSAKILAHQFDQHAFPQSSVGDPHSRCRKGPADRLENRAAREDEIGAVAPDAALRGTLLVAHCTQPRDGAVHRIFRHPQAVDATAVVAVEAQMYAGDRRHRAGRAQQMEPRTQVLRAQRADEGFEQLAEESDHLLIGRMVDDMAAETFRKGDDTEFDGHPGTRLHVGGAFAAVATQPDDFRGAAADIEEHEIGGRRIGKRAAAGCSEPRFRLAVDDLEPQPRLPRDAIDEFFAVGGGAAGFRRDETRARDTASVHLVAAYIERIQRARHRRIAQPAGGVETFAEADDARKGIDDTQAFRALRHACAGRTRDQQAAIVGAEVERGINIRMGARDCAAGCGILRCLGLRLQSRPPPGDRPFRTIWNRAPFISQHSKSFRPGKSARTVREAEPKPEHRISADMAAPSHYDPANRQPRLSSPALPPDFVALATTVLTTIMVIATVSILYFVREVFIPLVLAILLSFVLAPAMRLLQRARFPRVLAAVVIVLFAFGIISVLGTVLAAGMRDLADNLPRYQIVLRDKVHALKDVTAGSRTLDQASAILQDLSKELRSSGPAAAPTDASAPEAAQKPVPVVIREADRGPLGTITTLITPLLNPLAMTGVIIVFVIFILIKREDLRDRLIRLTGTRDLGRTTAAINDAARRLSRFYLTQLALNACFGLCIGLGLWFVGVPSPAIWGILAGVLRFVPYVGAIISAVMPLAVAAAVEPGWTMVIEAAIMFVVVETLVGQAIEPLVYGHSTGLSPVAVVVSATFWTWLWGPIGLVLATPLTMCLVVLGRHVERLRFLEVMFGNQPALSPPEIFYQRMLAADPAEAADHAEQFLKKRSLLTYYDTVAIEGLRLAQTDISGGLLSPEQVGTIIGSANEVVDELETEDHVQPSGGLVALDAETQNAVDANPEEEVPPLPILSEADRRPDWSDQAAVCIAGGSEIDGVVARIIMHLLERHGLPARALPASSLRSAELFQLDLSAARWICLSFMEAASTAHVRHAIRKIRRKAPSAMIVIAALREDTGDMRDLGTDMQGIAVLRSLRDVTEAALDAASVRDEAPAAAAATTGMDIRNAV